MVFIPVSMRSLCGLADLRYNLDGTFFTLDQTVHCKYSYVVLQRILVTKGLLKQKVLHRFPAEKSGVDDRPTLSKVS